MCTGVMLWLFYCNKSKGINLVNQDLCHRNSIRHYAFGLATYHRSDKSLPYHFIDWSKVKIIEICMAGMGGVLNY